MGTRTLSVGFEIEALERKKGEIECMMDKEDEIAEQVLGMDDIDYEIEGVWASLKEDAIVALSATELVQHETQPAVEERLETRIVKTFKTLALPALEEPSSGIATSIPREVVHRSWKVGHDATLDPSELGVELKTPVFIDSPVSNQGWKDEIAKVLSALTAEYGLWTNESTGLHVHVGMRVGTGGAFSLNDLKKIAAVVVLYEADLDDLHEPHRSEETPGGCFNSNRRNEFLKKMSYPNMVQRIFEAQTTAEIQRMLNPFPIGQAYSGNRLPSYTDRHYKVNFLSLDLYGTVEFRQHAGTVDPAAIWAWGDLVLAYVRKALSLSEQEIKRLDPDRDPLVPGILPIELHDAVADTLS